MDIVGSDFLRTKCCLSLSIHSWCVMGGWGVVLSKGIPSSNQASLGIMHHYAPLRLQSHSLSNERLLGHLPFLKSSKWKCQWLESILQQGSLYSIWEAFSFLYGKGGLWLFPEPHMVEGSSDNTGGWRNIRLLCQGLMGRDHS